MRGARQAPAVAGRPAFTLIEVMISLAIGMVLIALSWSAYRTSDQLAKRTLVRLALHQDAGQVQVAWTGDFRTVHHGAQFRVEGLAPASGPAVITVTALRSVPRTGWLPNGASTADWFTGGDTTSTTAVARYPTDLTWFRWRWQADSSTVGARIGTLYRAMAPRVRPGIGILWSQPRRSASRPLTDNTWKNLFQIVDPTVTGPNNYLTRNDSLSDEDDLTANLVPIALRVRDFAVAWTTNGGGLGGVDAASLTTSPVSYPIDGVWLDAHDSTLPRLRPAVLRVRFTLVDPAADLRNDPNALDAKIVQQSFVWSVPLTPLAQP